MAWVKPASFPNFARIFANGVTLSGGIGWGLVTQTNMHFTTLGVFDYQSGTIPAIPTTSFTHLACVMKDDTNRTVDFYVNGSVVASIAGGGLNANVATSNYHIGALMISFASSFFISGLGIVLTFGTDVVLISCTAP